MLTLAIERIRPTQLTRGAREVRAKAAQYAALSGHDLDMAIADRSYRRGPR